MRRRAFVALGANLGNPRETLREALDELDDVVAVSRLYETEPEGGPPGQPRYANAVCELATTRSPFDLLATLLAIETRHGRTRLVANGPRTLDLDLVWMDGVVVSAPPRLMVPHPRAGTRAFVLWPLADLDRELARRIAVGGLDRYARPPVRAWSEELPW